MCRPFALICLSLVLLGGLSAKAGELSVHVDFPNGSGVVQRIDQQTRAIRISPTEYPEKGWACWWYVMVQGIEPGETITVEVERAPWATPARAAISFDNRQWTQTVPGRRENGRIVYRQRIQNEQVWLAWGPPFTIENAWRIVNATGIAGARSMTLCETRGGQAVPALEIAAPDARFGVWIQARQHAWEAGSSWVCAGLVEWLLSDDPQATRLRSEARIIVVPVMDVDSVMIGAGGKNQIPRDHNRDWDDRPHWPAVAAAMQQIRQLDDSNQFDLFLDLHNPGPGDAKPFFYVPPRELMNELRQRNLQRFLAAGRQEIAGPLRLAAQTRESGADYDPHWQKISKNWVAMHTKPHVVSLTLETSWNTKHSTTEGYQTVGRQLGRAVARYLQLDPRRTGL